MKNKIKLIIVIGIIGLFILSFYFLVYTTRGSKIVAQKVISEFVEKDNVVIDNFQGNLASGVTIENLDIKDVKNFPKGTVLKIQRLFFDLTSLALNGIYAEVENTRLILPDSDPILISGTFKEQQFDLNIYSKGVTLSEVLSFLPDLKSLVPIKGDINDVDLYITGHYLEPVVKGSFIIEKFLYKGFLLTNVPLALDMRLKDIQSEIKLFGSVNLEKGEFHTNRVLVKLGKGSLKFSGPWDKPRINLRGSSIVEKVKISIVIKGTVEKPELTLTSESGYSQQKLMIMLATGKSWQSVEDSIDTGLNSAALTKDFIDYFFFAGKSNQFAEKFGISEFSVTFDEEKKGVAAKKEITDKLEVGYGIEQSGAKHETKDVTQKLEGELKINKELSVGVEREIKQNQASDLLNEQVNQNNDKVYIKYKKNF